MEKQLTKQVASRNRQWRALQTALNTGRTRFDGISDNAYTLTSYKVVLLRFLGDIFFALTHD